MDKKLKSSFALWGISDEWQEVIENYLVKGFEPGSFFTSVLANDLTGAATHSHPGNRWEDICRLCKWIHNESPTECHGSYNAVASWSKRSNAERRTICEEADLLMTAWDHLKEPA